METIKISQLNAKTELPVIVTYKEVTMVIDHNNTFLGRYKIGRIDGYKHRVDSIADLKNWIRLNQACIEEKRAEQEKRAARLAEMRAKCAPAEKEAPKTCYAQKAPVLNWTRTKNDINGNPRYICHFLDIAYLASIYMDPHKSAAENYKKVLKAANKAGGVKYRGRDFGGGIVFQSYNLADTEKAIFDICSK